MRTQHFSVGLGETVGKTRVPTIAPSYASKSHADGMGALHLVGTSTLPAEPRVS